MERQKKIYFEVKGNDMIDNRDIARIAKIAYDLDIDSYEYDDIREFSKSLKGVIGELENPSPELLLRGGHIVKAAVLYRDLNNTDYKTTKEAIEEMKKNIEEENKVEEAFNDAADVFGEAPHLITNFNKNEREIYENAIAEYGDDKLKIHDDAYDKYGNILEDSLSLHYYGPQNKLLDEFWAIQDRIEQEMK